jgi:hypothetical protein
VGLALEVAMDLLQGGLPNDEWQLGFSLTHLRISSTASGADDPFDETYCFLAQIILIGHDVWCTSKAY